MTRGFHAHDGWYFRREPGGGVIIEVAGSAQVDAPRRVWEVFDATTWASIVASVSAEGETGERFRKALDFHQEGEV